MQIEELLKGEVIDKTKQYKKWTIFNTDSYCMRKTNKL